MHRDETADGQHEIDLTQAGRFWQRITPVNQLDLAIFSKKSRLKENSIWQGRKHMEMRPATVGGVGNVKTARSQADLKAFREAPGTPWLCVAFEEV
jgi:hypothetical protein